MEPNKDSIECESPKRQRSPPQNSSNSKQRLKVEHGQVGYDYEEKQHKSIMNHNDSNGEGKASRQKEYSSDHDSISGRQLASLSLDNDMDTRSVGSLLKKKKKIIGSSRKRIARRQLKSSIRNRHLQSFHSVIQPKPTELSNVWKKIAQTWKNLTNSSSEESNQDEVEEVNMAHSNRNIFKDDSDQSSSNHDHNSNDSTPESPSNDQHNSDASQNNHVDSRTMEEQQHEEDIETRSNDSAAAQAEEQSQDHAQEVNHHSDLGREERKEETTFDKNDSTVITNSTAQNTSVASNPGIITLNGDDQNNNEEDEINTQGSQDTIMGPPQSNLPPWFRFRIIVNMPKLPDDIVAKKLKGEDIPQEYKNNDLRLLNIIKSFFSHVKDFDQSAMIMEWSSNNDTNELQAILAPDAIPSAPSETKKFIQGFKGKQTGPVYVKLRIATTFSHQDFTLNCKSWMQEHDCSVTKCPIQAENAEEIGWLSYSSQFSDKDYISAQLELVAGHEVGLRLAAIANKSESKIEWKKKSRGLIVVVPMENATVTKKLFTNLFKSRKEQNYENPNPILDLFHTFSFLPLEHELTKMPNCKANYAICLHRHQVHYKSIRAKFTPSILVDIDKKLSTRVGRLSLREMIMRIKSTDEKLKGATLFQSVDYTEDNSTIYLPYEKKLGKGEAGYLFQFYQCLEDEAIAMFQGLGVYLEATYGVSNLDLVFGVNHWAENAQWKWDDENKKFITPEELLVKDLLHLDSNAALMSIEATNIQNDAEEANVSAAARIMNNQQQRLIELLQNPDLDPITTLDTPVQQIVDEVVIDSNIPSAASSITDMNNDNFETSSQRTRHKDNTTSSNSSKSSSSSFGTRNMRNVLDPRLSAAENRQRLAAATTLKLNRLKQQQEQLDAELAAAEQLENSSGAEASEDFDKLIATDINQNDNNHDQRITKPPASSDMAGPKT